MEKLIINTAFFLGLAGSIHCFSMCGPITFIFCMEKKNKIKMIIGNIIYQIGRICSYTILGLIFGLLGEGFSLIGLNKFISILLGLIITLYSFFYKKNFFFMNIFNKKINYYINIIKYKFFVFIKQKKLLSMFYIGLLNGLLPCGLLYLAITTSISMGNIIYSIIFMINFGIGTIPIMFLSLILGNILKIYIKNKIIEIIMPLSFFLIGIMLLFRGLGLNLTSILPFNEIFIIKNKTNNMLQHQKKYYNKCH